MYSIRVALTVLLSASLVALVVSVLLASVLCGSELLVTCLLRICIQVFTIPRPIMSLLLCVGACVLGLVYCWGGRCDATVFLHSCYFSLDDSALLLQCPFHVFERYSTAVSAAYSHAFGISTCTKPSFCRGLVAFLPLGLKNLVYGQSWLEFWTATTVDDVVSAGLEFRQLCVTLISFVFPAREYPGLLAIFHGNR